MASCSSSDARSRRGGSSRPASGSGCASSRSCSHTARSTRRRGGSCGSRSGGSRAASCTAPGTCGDGGASCPPRRRRASARPGAGREERVDSRRRILDALRAASPPAPRAPDLSGVGVRWDDPVKKLSEMVLAVAGRLEGVPGTVDLSRAKDAHALEGLGLAVLPGAFAVAENGAVWVRGETFRPRGAFVIAEHLALVVPASEVVHDLHEAYRRIVLDGAGFGTFIAGPSKTADIEQALVIGAHGARSCTLFLVG